MHLGRPLGFPVALRIAAELHLRQQRPGALARGALADRAGVADADAPRLPAGLVLDDPRPADAVALAADAKSEAVQGVIEEDGVVLIRLVAQQARDRCSLL